MNRLRQLSRFRLRTILILITIGCVAMWWSITRPREQIRQQMVAGRRVIHDRDRAYAASVFDKNVQDHLVTVVGDSRLQHWDSVLWLSCESRDTIISYGRDGALLVWNRDDGSIRRGFYDLIAFAHAAQLDRFFFVTADGSLKSWSLGEDVPRDEPVELPKSNRLWLCCSPVGRQLTVTSYAAGQYTTVGLDRESGKRQFEVQTPTLFPTITFAPGGDSVLFVGTETIDERDVLTGELLRQLAIPPMEDGGTAAPGPALFSTDGSLLYVGDAGGRVFVYDWKQKELLHELPLCSGSIRAIALSGDSGSVGVASGDVRQYSTWSSPAQTRMSMLLDEGASALDVGPNGRVAGVQSGRIVGLHGRRMTGGPRVDATCFAFSPAGDQIALAGRDGQILIRETSTWKLSSSWLAHEGWVRRLVWSPQGALLCSLGDDRTLAFWNPETGEELDASRTSHSSISALSFSESGDLLLRSSPPALEIVRAANFEVVKSIPRKELRARGAALISKDQEMLFAGGSKSMVHVWNLEAGKLLRSFGRRSVSPVALAVDRREEFVFASDIRDVFVFDIASGIQLWSVRVHDHAVSDLALHPSRPILATAGDDGYVTLVDIASQSVLRRLRLGPIRGKVLQVEFSPDGTLLAAAMSNGAVVILRAPWD